MTIIWRRHVLYLRSSFEVLRSQKCLRLRELNSQECPSCWCLFYSLDDDSSSFFIKCHPRPFYFMCPIILSWEYIHYFRQRCLCFSWFLSVYLFLSFPFLMFLTFLCYCSLATHLMLFRLFSQEIKASQDCMFLKSWYVFSCCCSLKCKKDEKSRETSIRDTDMSLAVLPLFCLVILVLSSNLSSCYLDSRCNPCCPRSKCLTSIFNTYTDSWELIVFLTSFVWLTCIFLAVKPWEIVRRKLVDLLCWKMN